MKRGLARRMILQLLQQRPLTQIEIARILHLPPSTVSYNLKKLAEDGEVILDPKETVILRSMTFTPAKVWRLPTERERQILREVKLKNAKPKFTGIHAIGYKFPIIKRGRTMYVKEVQMVNWTKRYILLQDGLQMYETPSHIVLQFRVEDPDPERATERAKKFVAQVKQAMERTGYVLGEPLPAGRPKYEIIGDPVAEYMEHNAAIITPDGAIDNTPEPGTLHFPTLKQVQTYLKFPTLLIQLQESHKELEKKIDLLQQSQISINKAVSRLIEILQPLAGLSIGPSGPPGPGGTAEPTGYL